jgi:hypothetical protein
MNAKGQATLMGGSLVVNTQDTNWTLIIRRTDEKTDTSFYEYHDKPVTPDILKRFVPNYANLAWRHVPGIFSPDAWELFAVDREYRINIYPKDRRNLTDAALAESFVAVMNR